jgi:hypothetical protein
MIMQGEAAAIRGRVGDPAMSSADEFLTVLLAMAAQ